MPYRLHLKDKVSLIGTPDFNIDGCPPGYYHSVFVVRSDRARGNLGDYSDARFAYNQRHSQSGFAAAYEHLKSYGFWFDNCVHSGAHRASAMAVHSGKADIACLDAVSWRLMRQFDSFADDLHVLEVTQATPGLPYISHSNANGSAFFTSIQQAIAELATSSREQLGLHALVCIDQQSYLSVPNPPMRIMSASEAKP